jgi:hypothetical protein
VGLSVTLSSTRLGSGLNPNLPLYLLAIGFI